jgi:putative glycero-phosphotransferase
MELNSKHQFIVNKEMILYYCLIIFENILKIFWVFKIKKNSILFMSYDGEQFSCNPRFIYENMIADKKHRFNYIWILSDDVKKQHSFEKGTIIVKPYSLKYFYYITTSKIIISNNGIKTFIPIRKSQYYIETWHGGGAYKKTGIDVNKSKYEIKKIRKLSEKTSYFLASSSKVKNTKSKAHLLDENKFLCFGTPRNDLFFKECESLKKQIKKKLGISSENRILLYAPTFRNKKGGGLDEKRYEILDIDNLINMLEKKWNCKWVILYRAHHTIKNNHIFNDKVINVNDFEDMQYLLLISDILISDYSSSMWDFSFTGRPCFVYAPDLKEYKNERDFYTPIEDWPYPISENNDELRKKIQKFDFDCYTQSVTKHHKIQGSFERGDSTEKIVNFVINLIKGEG